MTEERPTYIVHAPASVLPTTLTSNPFVLEKHAVTLLGNSSILSSVVIITSQLPATTTTKFRNVVYPLPPTLHCNFLDFVTSKCEIPCNIFCAIIIKCLFGGCDYVNPPFLKLFLYQPRYAQRGTTIKLQEALDIISQLDKPTTSYISLAGNKCILSFVLCLTLLPPLLPLSFLSLSSLLTLLPLPSPLSLTLPFFGLTQPIYNDVNTREDLLLQKCKHKNR
jgi:hypothetical protein